MLICLDCLSFSSQDHIVFTRFDVAYFLHTYIYLLAIRSLTYYTWWIGTEPVTLEEEALFQVDHPNGEHEWCADDIV